MSLHHTRTRWLVGAGFGLALVLTLYFAIRVAMGAFYWSDPAHQDRALEGWMPLGYVGRSWDIPREAMLGIAGVDPEVHRHHSLEMIARDEGVPLPVLIERIATGIENYREQAQ